MNFLKEGIESFTHSGGQHSQSNPPPQPPPPWIAEWDRSQDRWIFINRETGERTHQFPQGGGYGGYQGGGGYGDRGQYQGGYGGGQYQGGYGGGGGYEQPHEKKSHGMAYGALGAAAGLAGGALLMHEGEEVKEGWERDKYRAEEGVYDAGQDIENFPDNAARWTGERVQDVENIPQDVDQAWNREENRMDRRWDDGVQDVEDFPENAARWTGEKVQEVEDIPQDIAGGIEGGFDRVENFGDRLENSYDQGEAEGRRDDW